VPLLPTILADLPFGKPQRDYLAALLPLLTRLGELPAVVLWDEGRRLYHAQLYYKPFKKTAQGGLCPGRRCRPRGGGQAHNPLQLLFSTDPEMAPARIYRIYRDRFQIECNFRDAKLHLGLTACQTCTAARHHFHVNAVLAALAWTRLELRHTAD